MWESFSPSAPLALIGCGKMGGAIARGWFASGLPESHCVVIDPEVARLGMEGLSSSCVFPSLADLPSDVSPSIFVLAVKPQIVPKILPAIFPYMAQKPLILSLVAGAKVGTIKEALGLQTPVVRAMPNTPAAIGKGITALYASKTVSDHQHIIAEALMQSVGKTLWLTAEDQMNAVTALSGSGPAYIFHMVEAMTTAAVTLGLEEELAATLARQTVIGAGALLDKDSRPVTTLRDEVTSPGGTTAAGLSELMGGETNLSMLMRDTLRAAKNRGEELG